MGVERNQALAMRHHHRAVVTRAARHALVLATVLTAVACGRSKSPRGSDDARGGSAGSDDGGRAGVASMDSGASGGSATESAGEGGVAMGARGGSAGMPPTAGTGNSGTSGTSGTSGQGNMGGTMPSAGSGGSGGDAGTGDTAGNGGEAALPLPEGCEPRGRTEDASSCSLGVFCDGVPNLTNCSRLESGQFQCSCELANHDRVYEIDGAPGIEACAVAAGLCFEDELELGEETCVAGRDSSYENVCDLELRCATPITLDFAPGAQASLVRYGSATCSREAGGRPFACGCLAGEIANEYGVLADSGELACRPLVDFCMSGMEPNFDEPTVCFPTDSHVESGVCDLYQACATPMRLTDDVSLARVEQRYASCSSAGAAVSGCYCSTPHGSFTFDVEAEPVANTCAESILNCSEGASIEPQGAVTCAPTSQTSGQDFCDADLECLQPASVDGRSIVSRGRLLVYCRREGAQEPWWCSCASNQDSTIVELGAEGLSSWDACGEAPARCVEEMPVFIGMYGEYVPPPDPLPGSQ